MVSLFSLLLRLLWPIILVLPLSVIGIPLIGGGHTYANIDSFTLNILAGWGAWVFCIIAGLKSVEFDENIKSYAHPAWLYGWIRSKLGIVALIIFLFWPFLFSFPLCAVLFFGQGEYLQYQHIGEVPEEVFDRFTLLATPLYYLASMIPVYHNSFIAFPEIRHWHNRLNNWVNDNLLFK